MISVGFFSPLLHAVELVLPYIDLREPLGVLLLLETDGERGNTRFEVAEDILIHADVLVDFFLIDFELDDLRLLTELLAVARDSVGETRAAGNHEVTFRGDLARFIAAVHADVADKERMTGRNRAESHQRAAYGRVDQLREREELLAGVRAENAAARVDHRTLSIADQLLHPADAVGILYFDHLGTRGFFGEIFRRLRGDVLGNVDQDGTLSAVLGKRERLADRGREILDALNQPACLGDGLDDVDDVDLLKAVSAELVGVDVGGDRHHRNRIDIGCGKTRNDVRRTGTRGGEHHARFACRTGIAVRRMGSALFVGGENMVNSVAVAVERVIGIERSAAGIAEYGVDTLLQQTFANDFRTC